MGGTRTTFSQGVVVEGETKEEQYSRRAADKHSTRGFHILLFSPHRAEAAV
jgi:hypothetical protein